MDKFERRLVIKFLFIEGLRSKTIHTELETTFDATVDSLTQAGSGLGDSRQVTLLARTILAQADRMQTERSLSAIFSRSFCLHPVSFSRTADDEQANCDAGPP
jgi:hypothetical protein